MRKFLTGMLVLSLILTTSMTSVYAGTPNNEKVHGKEVVYTVPEEESFEEANAEVLDVVKEELKDYLKLEDGKEIILSDECYDLSLVEESADRSDSITYISNENIKIVNNGIATRAGGAPTTVESRVIYHTSSAKLKNAGWKYATGLTGGYRGATYLYYTPTGGGGYTFSVSAAAGYGPISISATVGKQANKDIGMALRTTSTQQYNRVQSKKDYKVTPFTIQIRNSKTAPWKTLKKGNIAKYYRVAAKCVKVK